MQSETELDLYRGGGGGGVKHLTFIFVISPFWCYHNDEGSGLGYDFDCRNGNCDGLGLGVLSGLGLGGLSGLGLNGLCSANPLTFWCSSGTFSKTKDLVVGE